MRIAPPGDEVGDGDALRRDRLLWQQSDVARDGGRDVRCRVPADLRPGEACTGDDGAGPERVERRWRHVRIPQGIAGADRVIGLTPKEFGVLEVLMKHSPAPVSAELLLEKVWDEHADPFTNAVRVTMVTLRRKLGDPPLIETVKSVGYRVPVG